MNRSAVYALTFSLLSVVTLLSPPTAIAGPGRPMIDGGGLVSRSCNYCTNAAAAWRAQCPRHSTASERSHCEQRAHDWGASCMRGCR